MGKTIVLIRPQNVYNYNNYPQLGLICVGSALRAKGYDVRIINCAFEQDSPKAIAEALPPALMACVSMITSEVPDAYRVIQYIKNNSRVPVVVGGWHPTLFPEQMDASPLIDYVIEGEGEEHLVSLADQLASGNPPQGKRFSRRMLDMEKLPLPDYSIDPSIERFISSYLTDKLSEYVRQPMRWLPYESSRGCPSQCTFCINVVADNTRYRKKSALKVLTEISEMVKRYRLTHLKIIDDNFFVDIKRTREICEGMIQRGLEITWDAECRCDYFNERMINDELLKLLKRSGLVQLTLGIESGSAHTLKLMKKGITPVQAEHAVRKCDEYSIIARSAFILEIPDESMADLRQTILLVNRLRKYKYFTCGVGTFRPYPKCELTEGLIQKGYLQEPKALEEWTARPVIDLYTSAEYVRPWQVNGAYSESASYYLNMESAVRLGNHQIDRWLDRFKNSLFMLTAKLRNRAMFYGWPIEKNLYKKFLVGFYARRKDLEKAGQYPLSSNQTLKPQGVLR